MLFKSEVTKLLILPIRLPLAFCGASFSLGASIAFCFFVDPFSVDVEVDVDGSRTVTVELSETEEGSRAVDSARELASESEAEVPCACESGVSGLDDVLVGGRDSTFVDVSALKRIRKLCSNTS